MEEERSMRKLISIAVVLLLGVVSLANAAPPAGSLLWLKADAGVIEDGSGVLTWEDQSGNDIHAQRSAAATGSPQLSTAGFPLGTFPVISFNGNSRFLLDQAALRTTEISVYAVLDVDVPERGAYYGNYSNSINWGWGLSLNALGGEGRAMHAYSGAGTQDAYSDWAVGGTPPGSKHVVTTTISQMMGSKAIYVDGSPLGSTAITDFQYDPDYPGAASIGALMDYDLFQYDGDIAELIIYPSVDMLQQAMVEDYLYNKYLPEPATMSLLGLGALALLRRRRS
jgi:hypothetical protein